MTVTANPELNHFLIPQGCYQARNYAVEGDASSASYFWAAAAVTGGRVTVANVPSPSLQGDAVLVDILARMGCTVERTAAGITVTGTKELRGVEVDMGDCPDVVPTLAVVASFAKGRTVIKNIAHLRIKECDRLHVMVTELAKLGVKTEERPDAMIIEGKAENNPSARRGNRHLPRPPHRHELCRGRAGGARCPDSRGKGAWSNPFRISGNGSNFCTDNAALIKRQPPRLPPWRQRAEAAAHSCHKP